MTETAIKKKILFVDDEFSILSGLNRMLRGMREEWDMEFAQGAEDALDLLSGTAFDVVVADLRMPGMDGADLLARVKEIHPRAVRIILSGHADRNVILKTVLPAHQFLTKPCDAHELKSAVHRACSLQKMLADERLTGLVSQIDRIPALPAAYMQLMDLLQQPECTIKQVGDLMSTDIGMSAKILQVVNSSFFGVPRHVSNPAQAVGLLGLETLRALVLMLGVFSKFDSAIISAVPLDTLQNHCMQTAAIARDIALLENLGNRQVDYLFMAGILHDVGKLVLAQYLPEAYQNVLEMAHTTGMPISESEQALLGAGHAEIGGYLMGIWGLPDDIVQIIAFHHRPNLVPEEFRKSTLILSIANWLQHREEGNIIHPEPDWPLMNQVGSYDHLPRWIEIAHTVSRRKRDE
ncbi:MAG: HDOD domain-containing protein [Desulfatirhabdiaceae bacterium]